MKLHLRNPTLSNSKSLKRSSKTLRRSRRYGSKSPRGYGEELQLARKHNGVLRKANEEDRYKIKIAREALNKIAYLPGGEKDLSYLGVTAREALRSLDAEVK
jgi:hypothetical protein